LRPRCGFAATLSVAKNLFNVRRVQSPTPSRLDPDLSWRRACSQPTPKAPKGALTMP